MKIENHRYSFSRGRSQKKPSEATPARASNIARTASSVVSSVSSLVRASLRSFSRAVCPNSGVT